MVVARAAKTATLRGIPQSSSSSSHGTISRCSSPWGCWAPRAAVPQFNVNHRPRAAFRTYYAAGTAEKKRGGVNSLAAVSPRHPAGGSRRPWGKGFGGCERRALSTTTTTTTTFDDDGLSVVLGGGGDDASSSDRGGVSSANLDWGRLGFDFQRTNGYVKHTWENGKWDDGVFEPEPYVKIHVMSSCIHYGQAVFEGAKAHQCADGVVRLWNVSANAQRMRKGCERMMMPEVSEDMFIRACEWAVAANKEFIPPYASKGAMYLRPYVFGHGPQLGLSPAPSFHFCVLAIPVSSYYSGGLRPIDALVVEDSDRAAPKGVGHVKAAGNYGSDILVSVEARAEGFPTVLYLDALEHKYVEEFSVSNFVGIKHAKNGEPATYVTPDTSTVLRSITNDLLADIAKYEFDMRVERRPVHVDELDEFDEVAGCGTAVVMMGIKSLTHRGRKIEYAGIDTVTQLYDKYRAIQFGDAQDRFGWGVPCPTMAEVERRRELAAQVELSHKKQQRAAGAAGS